MSEPYPCPHDNPDCSFGEDDEQALVAEVMRSIERHNKKSRNTSCPLCLRDTMLAAAALLHLEGARTGMAGVRKPRANSKQYQDAFAKAARKRLDEVIQAKAALFRHAH